MKPLWLLVSLTSAFVTALVLSFFFGSSGLRSYGQLAQANSKLEANVAENEAIRAQLLEAVDDLQNNPERIRLEARTLGYYLPDEHVLLIRDYQTTTPTYSPGNVILVDIINHNSRSVFRIIAICVGLVCFLLLISIERRANEHHSLRASK